MFSRSFGVGIRSRETKFAAVPPASRPGWLKPFFVFLSLFLLTLAPVVSAAQATAQDALHQAANLVEWGRWKEARDVLSAALQKEPNNAPLMAYDAHVLISFGDVDEALHLAKQAVKLDSQCATCHLYLSEALGERARHMNRMRALMQLHHIRQELETALQLGSNIGDVHWGWINFELDIPAAVGGSAQRAGQEADALARIDPVDGHIAHATIDLSTGHPNQAMAEYEQAARQYPKDPRGIFYVGLTLFQRGQHAAALPYLEKAQDLQPQSALYAGYYAANLVYLKRQNDARAVLDSARRRFPDSRLGDYLVAEALRKEGQNFDWARQLLSAYLAVPPEPDQPSRGQAEQLLSALG